MGEAVKERVEWIDVAKAIAVYCVILGHLVLFNYTPFRFIFAFHMPLFFVVAGYVFGKKEEKPFKTFLKAQSRYYLIPFLVVMILGVLQCYFVPLESQNANTIWSIENIKKTFYFGHPVFSVFGSAWFLLAMFEAQIFFYCMRKIASKISKWIYVLLWILWILLALYAKDIFSVIPIFHRLPLKMDSALMATVFMGIGYLIKRIGIMERMKAWIASLLVPFGALVVWFIGVKNNYYVNLCDCDYAKYLNFLIAAVAGTFMIFALSFLLRKSRLLQFIGRNTLIIFLSHQIVLSCLVGIVNQIWKKELIAQYMQLDVWCIGISIVTLTITTLIAWGYQWVKKKISDSKRKRTENRNEEN